jgi:hypothetical protein
MFFDEILIEVSDVFGGTVIKVSEVRDEFLTEMPEVHVSILTDVSEAFDVIHCKELPKLLL